MKSLDFLKIDLIKTIDWPAARKKISFENSVAHPQS